MIPVPGVDSKVGEWIYPLRGVVLIQFLQNDQISIRNIKEIHELVPNKQNKHFYQPTGLSHKFNRLGHIYLN